MFASHLWSRLTSILLTVGFALEVVAAERLTVEEQQLSTLEGVRDPRISRVPGSAETDFHAAFTHIPPQVPFSTGPTAPQVYSQKIGTGELQRISGLDGTSLGVLGDAFGPYIAYTSVPDTNQNRAAIRDRRHAPGAITVYDRVTGIHQRIHESPSTKPPRIHGRFVTWEERLPDSSLTHVKLCSLDALPQGSPPVVIAGSSDPSAPGSSAGNPDVGSRFVVWDEKVDSTRDVKAYELGTGRTLTIATSPFEDERLPVTSGSWIAYEVTTSSNGSRIEAFNVDSGERVVVAAGADASSVETTPAIDGNFIVWASFRNNNFDVWLYRLAEKDTFNVTAGAGDQREPDILEGWIVHSSGLPGSAAAFASRFRFEAVFTADAGEDRMVECDRQTAIILDGSNSRAPNGSALTHDWFEGERALGRGVTLPINLSLGVHTIRLVVTDESGGTALDTVTITVRDTTPPSITGPPDVTVSTPASATACGVAIDAAIVGRAAATDACEGNINVVSNAPVFYPVGETLITYTATDAGGNRATATQKITVLDGTPPQVSCPADLSADTNPGTCVGSVHYTATATDNCPGLIVTSSPPSGSFFPRGTTTVTTTATDAAGNSASCSFRVGVSDREPPRISAPADVLATNDRGLCTATVCPGVPLMSDNCPATTLASSRSDNMALNAPYPAGETLVTWTATDASGNSSSAVQRVRAEDNEAPVILGLSVDKPQLFPANGKMVDVAVNYTVTDNCGGAKPRLDISSNETDSGSSPDWEIVDLNHVRLRAERNPSGSGRIYTITVTTYDPKLQTTQQSINVTVGK